MTGVYAEYKYLNKDRVISYLQSDRDIKLYLSIVNSVCNQMAKVSSPHTWKIKVNFERPDIWGAKRYNCITLSLNPQYVCFWHHGEVCVGAGFQFHGWTLWNILVCMSLAWYEGLQVSIYISTHTESCWNEVPNVPAKGTRAWLTLCLNFLRHQK